MSGRDRDLVRVDADRLLATWFDADALGAVPRDGLERALVEIARRPQRRRWSARAHDLARRLEADRPGRVPHRAQPQRAARTVTMWPAAAWLLLLLLVALLAVTFVVGALQQRHGLPALQLVYADDTGLTIVAPDGVPSVLTHEVVIASYEDPRWAPSGRFVSAFIKGARELRVFDAQTGDMVGDTHGVIDYRWVSSPTNGSDTLIVRQGSAVRLLSPTLDPLGTIEVGDAPGTFDATADAATIAIVAGSTIELLRYDGRTVVTRTALLTVARDTVRRLTLSPDGRWVGLLSADCPDACDGLLRIVPTAGGRATVLDDKVWPGSGVAWRSDSSTVLVTERSGGQLLPAEVSLSGAKTPVATGTALDGPGVVGVRASWDELDRGYLLAVSTRDGGTSTTTTWRIDPSGTMSPLVSNVNGTAVWAGP